MDRDAARKKLGTAVLGGLAVFLTGTFINALLKAEVDPLVAAGISALCSGVVLLLLDLYGHRLRSWTAYRKAFHRVALFEGYWVQTTTVSDRPTAFAKIYYDPGQSAWVYRGTAFDTRGKPAARWEMRSIIYDDREREWLFKGKCQWIRKQKAGWRPVDPPSDVFCRLVLARGDNDAISKAFAVDIDLNDGPFSFLIELQRASTALMKQYAFSDDPNRIESVTFTAGEVIARRQTQALDDPAQRPPRQGRSGRLPGA